ncbi:helix-turn-helix domain-containing protein, partial [Deinococcus marmoris]
MCYHRFTLPLRYQLQALHQAQQPIPAIAAQLGFHRTTIRRELARVSPYDAELAHHQAHDEQERRHHLRIQESVWDAINEQL